ncbi:hypothetical protein D9611_002768 [Ephemerocybe angulata]|uniref:Uncharacterized protein n=1 Tax=Ephemerocybe angulata TaxID=980116 RepID=A0A8H5FDZ1_9AGAR|nr:hypothetical protein D9611_002768 [Tulosesus angulatus]
MPPDPDFPEDPTFDISHIAGNASPSTKRVLGNVPLFFRNRYPATVKGPIFAESIFPRIKVVEITTDENREPEVVGKKVGRVVVEVVVDDDMLNGGATLHAGCAAALIAMTSTSAIEALIAASAGHVINNLSQAVNVIYHSPAENVHMSWILTTLSFNSGKGLAAHLEVPLPYLLYRVNARFQEEIKGLKDIQGALSPTGGQPPPSPFAAESTSPRTAQGERPSPLHRLQTRMTGSSRLSSSSKLNTPLGVRARLNSLTNNAPRPKKIISSSTLTLQASKKEHLPLRPTSPSSGSDGDSEDDEEARKEEEAERAAEEQETLNRRLEELQRMMTNDAIGLVSTARPRRRSLNQDRGSRSGSQSVSDTGSPQGSIPDIPSPADNSQSQSPRGRYSTDSRTSPRFQNGERPRNYVHSDEYGSSHGSETSSFTDLSDASVSASALESALMSNIRGGGGSRLSQFVPSSRVISRSSRLPR